MPSLLLSCNLGFWLSWHCCPSAFTAQRRWLPDTVACVGEGATFKPACKLYRMVAMTTGSTATPVPGRRCAHSSHFEKKILGFFFGKPGNPQSFYLSAPSDMRKRHRQGYYQLLLPDRMSELHGAGFTPTADVKQDIKMQKFRLIALTAC